MVLIPKYESGASLDQFIPIVLELFSYPRGVRQGDPLSPLLVDLVEGFLSRYLTALSSSGALKVMSVGRATSIPYHLFCRRHFTFLQGF